MSELNRATPPEFARWGGPSVDAKYAVQSFVESARLFDDDGFAGGPYAAEGYLESYFYYWLSSGRAISETQGSPAAFIEATQRITDMVLRDPGALDCVEMDKPRRILGIFDPNLDRPHCFDPRVYETWKFTYLTRNHPEE